MRKRLFMYILWVGVYIAIRCIWVILEISLKLKLNFDK